MKSHFKNRVLFHLAGLVKQFGGITALSDYSVDIHQGELAGFMRPNGARLFPAATFYFQKDEYRFWLEYPVATRPSFRHVSDPFSTAFLASLEGTKRLVLLKCDQQILPGIECLLSPGHTVALQTVAVKNAPGTAVIGSDCAHILGNNRQDWPSALIVDLVGWMKTYDKLRQNASSPDLLFSGHERLLLQNYLTVAKDVTRLA